MKKEDLIFFYEHEFYPFSNFSSFNLDWRGKVWMTSEHAYHSEKFEREEMKEIIFNCRSAHEALKYAEENISFRRKDWNEVKLGIMKEILHAKVEQHPYVRKKLLESGDKKLIEDSWRDDFWGWGPNKDGQNHLGKLWMEVRQEVLNKEKSRNKNGGYSGLFLILIGATLIVLLVSHIYFKKGTDQDPRSGIEKNLEAIEEAKSIKNMLEERDRERAAEIQ